MTTYSPPNPTTKEKVSAFYAAVFNRAPDKDGLNFWVATASGAPSESAVYLQLGTAFTQHQAFEDIYGTHILDSLGTKTTFINALYSNMLGSEGDAEGVAYWVGLLGSVSVAEVVSSFVQSALSVDLSDASFDYLSDEQRALAESRQAYITNKAQVGVFFAEHMDVLSNLLPGTNPSSDIETLLADSHFLASTNIVSSVTDDPASVAAANAAILHALDQVDPVAFINNTWGNNDLGSFTYAQLLSGAISVDGGYGEDTLTITAIPDGARFRDNLLAFQHIQNVEVLNLVAADGAQVDLAFSQNAQATGIKAINLSGNYTASIISVEGYSTGVEVTTANGADTIYGSTGADTINAGGGNDYIDGGDGAAADVLSGGAGSDTIIGNDGADTLTGGVGNDDLQGGSGNDVFTINTNGELGDEESIDGAAGLDFIALGASQEYVFSSDSSINNVEGIVLTTNSAGYDVVLSSNMADGSDLDTENPVYRSEDSGNFAVGATVLMTHGVSIDASAFSSTNQLYIDNSVFAGNDTFTGGYGADSISGGAGNDVIQGGLGADVLNGNEGDDRFVIATTVELISDSIDGGSGTDSLLLNANNAYVLNGDISHVEEVHLNDAAEGFGVFLYEGMGSSSDNNGTVTVSSDVNTTAGQRIDASDFTTAHLEVVGTNLSGDDTIYGGSESDAINAGSGDNYVIGEDGDDSIVTGSGDDTIYGDEGVDTIYAGSGNDYVVGGAGMDALYGQDGNDTFAAAQPADIIDDTETINGGTGYDTIALNGGEGGTTYDFVSGVNHISHVENIALVDGASVTVLLSDAMAQTSDSDGIVEVTSSVGNTSGVTVDASDFGLGARLLVDDANFAGNDNFIGGSDADTVNGGSGSDTLVGGAGLDSLDGGAGADWFLVDQASDIISVSGTETIDGGLENDSIILMNAGTYDFTTGSNHISGIDAIYVNDQAGYDVILSDELVDSSDYNLLTVASGSNISNSVRVDASDVQAGDRVSLGQNGTWFGDDTLIGGDGDDFINGSAGSDGITGNGGADTIYGGSDNDVINLASNDDLNGDIINGGTGLDTLNLTESDAYYSSYADISNVEIVAIDANQAGFEVHLYDNMASSSDYEGDDSGTIEVIANQAMTHGVYVNATDFSSTSELLIQDSDFAGDDTFVGGYGNDTIDGGAGNDEIYGEDGNDVIIGGAGNDYISGEDGNDVITAGIGEDTVSGGYGADTIYLADGNERDLVLYDQGYFDSNANAFDTIYGLDFRHDQISLQYRSTDMHVGALSLPESVFVNTERYVNETVGFENLGYKLEHNSAINLALRANQSDVIIFAVFSDTDSSLEGVYLVVNADFEAGFSADSDMVIKLGDTSLPEILNNLMYIDASSFVGEQPYFYVPQAAFSVNTYDGSFSVQTDYADVEAAYDDGVQFIRGNLHTIDTVDATDEENFVTFYFSNGQINGATGQNVEDLLYVNFDAFEAGRLGSDVFLSDTGYDAINDMYTSRQTVHGGDGYDRVLVNGLELLGRTDEAIDEIYIYGGVDSDISRLNAGLVTGAEHLHMDGSYVRMTETQYDVFGEPSDAITGWDWNGIGIATGRIDTITTSSEIEYYNIEDDLINDAYTINLRTPTQYGWVYLDLQGSDDVVTIDGTDFDDAYLVLSGDASHVTINHWDGYLDLTTFAGTAVVNMEDSSEEEGWDGHTIYTGEDSITVNSVDGEDGVNIYAGSLDDGETIVLSGQFHNSVYVYNVQSSVTIEGSTDAPGDQLTSRNIYITTYDDSSDDHIVVNAGSQTQISLGLNDESDTVVLNVDEINDNALIDVYGQSDLTINDLHADNSLVNALNWGGGLTGTLVVNTSDDGEADSIVINASRNNTTVNAVDGSDDLTVHVDGMLDENTLVLTGESDITVDGVNASITIDADSDATAILNGGLVVNIVDDGSSDSITVWTGSNDTTVNAADDSDTVVVNAGDMLDITTLGLSGESAITVNDVTSSLFIDANFVLQNGTLVVNTSNDVGEDNITVLAGSNDTTINANDAEDNVTVNVDDLADEKELVLTGESDITVGGVQSSIYIDADSIEPGEILNGTLEVNTYDDNASDDITIYTGSNNTTVNAADESDTVTVDVADLHDAKELVLTGESDITVDNVHSSITIDADSDATAVLNGTLVVNTEDDSDADSITIYTGSNDTTVNAADESDTVTVDVTDLLDAKELVLTGESDITVDGVQTSITIDADSTEPGNILNGTLVVNTYDDGSSDDITIYTGSNDTTVNAVDESDTVTVDVTDMVDTKELVLTGESDITVDGVQSSITIDADNYDNDGSDDGSILNGTLVVNTYDDGESDNIEIYTGSNDTSVNGTDASDTIVVNAYDMIDGTTLILEGLSAVTVDDVQSSITIDADDYEPGNILNGTLVVNTYDDSDADSITIYTGSNDTTVNAADESDTVTVDADNLTDEKWLVISGESAVTVDNVEASITIDANAGPTAIFNGTLVVNIDSDSDADNPTVGHDITILTGSNDTTVNSADDSDTVTIEADDLANAKHLILSGESDITVNDVQASITIDADYAPDLTGTLVVNTYDDGESDSIVIATGSNDTTVNAVDESDTVTVYANDLADTKELVLTGESDITVSSVLSSITIDADDYEPGNILNGTLVVNTYDDGSSDDITIYTGSNDTTVNAVDESDTVTIDADNLTDEKWLVLTGESDITVNDVQASIRIDADSSEPGNVLNGTLVVNTYDDSDADDIGIATGSNDTTVNAVDESDTVTVYVNDLADDRHLVLTGESDITVDNVHSSITIDADDYEPGNILNGTLVVNTYDDGSSDDITIYTGSNDTTVNAADESDTVTVDADNLTDEKWLVISGESAVTVDNVEASITIDANAGPTAILNGTLVVNIDSDSDADNPTVGHDITILTGSNDTTVNSADDSDTVTIEADNLANAKHLVLTGESDITVNDVQASITIDADSTEPGNILNGTLVVSTYDDGSSDDITIYTGSNDTTVNAADESDTVTVDVADMVDTKSLVLTGESDITVDGVQSSITIDADSDATAILNGTLVVNTVDDNDADSIEIYSGSNDTTVNAVDESDTVTVDVADMVDTKSLVLTGESDITVYGVQSSITIDADNYDNDGSDDGSILNGTLVVNTYDDGESDNIEIYTGSNDTSVNGTDASDTIVVNAYDMIDGTTLILEGLSAVTVDDVASSITIDADSLDVEGEYDGSILNGTLEVNTYNDSDADDITIYSGSNFTTVNAVDALDTVTVDVADMLDAKELVLTGESNITVDNVQSSITIDADSDATPILNGTLVVNTFDDSDADSIIINTGSNFTTVNAVDASDDVVINVGNTEDGNIIGNLFTQSADLVITGASDVTVNGVHTDMGINADGSDPGAILTGTLVVNTYDDNRHDTFGIGTGSGDTTINSNDDQDYLLINTGFMGSDGTLELNGDAEIAFITNVDFVTTLTNLSADGALLGDLSDSVTAEAAVDTLLNDLVAFDSNSYTIDAADFNGLLNVSLFADGSSDAYTIITGSGEGGLGGPTDGGLTRIVVRESLDTAVIDVTAIDSDAVNVLNDAPVLSLAGNGSMTVNGVHSDINIVGNGLGFIGGIDLVDISDASAAIVQNLLGLNGTLEINTTDDGESDDIIIFTGSNDTTVNAVDESDTVFIIAANMKDDAWLTLSGQSNMTVVDVQSDLTIDAHNGGNALHGTLDIVTSDDSDADSIVIYTGTNDTTVVGEDGLDTLLIHADDMSDATILSLLGLSDVTVDGVQSDLTIDADNGPGTLTGTLDINTADDSDADNIIIYSGVNDTTVNAVDASDTVTIHADRMNDEAWLTLSGESAITVDGVQSSITIDANSDDTAILNGTLVVNMIDDSDADNIVIWTGSNSTTVNAADESDTVVIHVDDMADESWLTLTGESDITVNGVQSSITIDADSDDTAILNGILVVNTSDDSELDNITIWTGSNDTTVNAVDESDTVIIHVNDMLDETTLALSGESAITVDGVQSDLTIDADSTVPGDILNGTLVVNTFDDGSSDSITIYTGSNDTTVNAVDESDTVVIYVDDMADDSWLTLSGSSPITVDGVQSSITIDANSDDTAIFNGILTVNTYDDDEEDNITIHTGSNDLYLDASDALDNISIDVADMVNGKDLVLSGASDITVSGVQSDITIDADSSDPGAILTGTLTVNVAVDESDVGGAFDDVYINTGSNDTTVNALDEGDFIYIDAADMLNNKTLRVTGEAANEITNLHSNLIDTSNGDSHIYIDATDTQRGNMTINLGASTTDGQDVLILSNTLDNGSTANFLEVIGFDTGDVKDALIISNGSHVQDPAYYTTGEGSDAENTTYDSGQVDFTAGYLNDFHTGNGADATGLVTGSVIEIDAGTFTVANYNNLNAIKAQLATIDNVASGAEFLVVVYSGDQADSNAFIYHVYSDRQGDGLDFASDNLDGSDGISWYDELTDGGDINGDLEFLDGGAPNPLYGTEQIDEHNHDAIELVGILYGVGANTLTSQNFYSEALAVG